MAQRNPYTQNYSLPVGLDNQPEPPVVAKRAPLTTDNGYNLGQIWVYPATSTIYMLSSVIAGVASWEEVQTTGAATTFAGNTGTATPSAGILNVIGSNGCVTSATGNTITVQSQPPGILPVSDGGTGVDTIPAHCVMIGEGTSAIATTATGSAGQVLQSGGASADPSYSTATYPATTAQGDLLISSSANTVTALTKNATATKYVSNTGTGNNPAWAYVAMDTGVTGTLAVGNGGTGQTSFTADTILIGNGTSAIGTVGPLTNGQLVIGSTSNAPVAATLTQGFGISITNAAGAITIAANGTGINWVNVTSGTQAAAVDTGYIANYATLCTITLPATAAIGQIVGIVGSGAGGWKIAQNSGQTIYAGSATTTPGTGGYLASTNIHDCIELICTATNTGWTARNMQGNITYV